MQFGWYEVVLRAYRALTLPYFTQSSSVSTIGKVAFPKCFHAFHGFFKNRGSAPVDTLKNGRSESLQPNEIVAAGRLNARSLGSTEP